MCLCVLKGNMRQETALSARLCTQMHASEQDLGFRALSARLSALSARLCIQMHASEQDLGVDKKQLCPHTFLFFLHSPV